MSAMLLSIHVLAAILAIGPIAICASMFPAAARAAAKAPNDARQAAVLGALHRICRVYAVIGVLVPVFGIATGASLGVLTDAWLIVSMVLTAAAATLLIAGILPGQRAAIAALDAPTAFDAPTAQNTPKSPSSARLAMTAGFFNLLWAVVVVLMIIRPGSTTGVGA